MTYFPNETIIVDKCLKLGCSLKGKYKVLNIELLLVSMGGKGAEHLQHQDIRHKVIYCPTYFNQHV